MKNLMTLCVLGALVAFGGAFLGQWKIPGLENLPTAESLKQSSSSKEADLEGAAESRLEQGNDGARPVGYYSTGSSSASSKRNKKLQDAGKEMGVE